jgi:DNA-binding NtrC family response regulator
MPGGNLQFYKAAIVDRPQDRTEVLAICVPSADLLGCALEAVLLPAPNVSLVRETLPEQGMADYPAICSSRLAKLRPDLLLLCLPPGGLREAAIVFEAVRRHQRELFTLVILETIETSDLQQLIGMGAADFCLAPLRLDDLLPRIMRWSGAVSARNTLTRQLEESWGLKQFLGESRIFLEALHRLPKLAQCDASILITGETGTGKEMCARGIHQLGPRSDHPFVPVNCGAIPSELVENELFGHDAGAFTGASTAVSGLIHDAEGGTLFLDEIDALPLQTQVKFLRFLQDQQYRPLGARKSCHADIRIIAASNADLEGAVRAGRFRADLYYRLNILPLKLPPLRDRVEDIPLLARHFAAKYAREFSKPVVELSRSATDKLLAYAWPGNVRELENIIERAVVFSDNSLITSEDICLPAALVSAEEMCFKTLKARAIAEFESAFVRRLLAANDGNISKAARASKKHRRAFWQLMRKHEIVTPLTPAEH